MEQVAQKNLGRKQESTNGGGEIFDGARDEADKKAALAHPGVSDQQDLEREIIAAPLP